LAGGAPPPTPIAALKTSIIPEPGISVRDGNVYFAADNCVFKIDANGVLTRVAGNSRWGSSPDGGLAISAEFSSAGSVAVDHIGNIYVVDANVASGRVDNTTVRKIAPDGTISTVVTGLNAGSRVNHVELAVGSGNDLYIIDGSYIRKLSADGKVSLVAGNGTETFSGDGAPALNAGLGIPVAIAVDDAGNLYIAADQYEPTEDDYEHGRVRVVTPDGMINSFAGTGNDGYSGDGGSASLAQISYWIPALAVDGAGNVLIVDAGNHAIRKITPDGTITSLQTQDQSGCYLRGSGPYICAGDIAVDSQSRIYIVGQYNRYIQMLGDDGRLTTIAGAGAGPDDIGDGGPAISAPLANPLGIAVDASHNVYIGDELHNRIRRVAPDGTITTAAGNGAVDLSGAVDPVVDGVPAVSVPLSCASAFSCKGIATDAAGNFFFTDGDRVRKVSSSGIITTAAHVSAHGLASDGRNLFIADPSGGRIRKLAADGTLTTIAGNGTYGHAGDGGQATSAQLFVPVNVAVDGAGNLYIAENYQTRIRKVTPDGTISTIAGAGNLTGEGIAAVSASLAQDVGIAADRDGNVYIAELENDRIRKISTDGIITTIAGGVCRLTPNNPCAGYIGDGGPAANAQLSGPARLAMDSDGNVYVADLGNNAVRVLRPIH
jgi:hypothetical protein